MSVYILLLHGRNDPDEHMDGWGFTGPVLGPFEAIHGTYAAHLMCYQEGVCVLELCYHDDMLVHDGRYYGDFEITASETGIHRRDVNRIPTNQTPSRAVYPQQPIPAITAPLI